MRIKYITNVRLPTSRAQGYAIMKMCSEFAKAGAETELFVPARGNTRNKKDPFEYYGIEKNFEIKKISSFDFLGMTQRFGKIFYWLDILSFLAITKFKVKLEAGDALYTRDFMAILFFSKQKRAILEIHDIPKSKLFFAQALKKAKLFVVLNSYLKEELVSLGVSPDKIIISPSGVEPQDFEVSQSQADVRREVGLPQDKKIILYTGQFYPWKGGTNLAETAKLVPEENFVFVGGAEPEYSRFKKKYQNISNIIINPFQTRAKVALYMKASDILVIPNSGKEKISSHYTSPLKLFEYMAAQKPIIVSDLPSIRDIVNEEDAVFAKPDSPQSFAEAIEKILGDVGLARKISLNVYEKVKRYSWQERAKKIMEKIKEIA